MIDYKVPGLTAQLLEHLKFKQQIMKQSVKMAKKDGKHLEGRVVTEGDYYFGKLAAFAVHAYTFFECFECGKNYFGGAQDCLEAMQQEDNIKREDLLCDKCRRKKSLNWGEKECEDHGNEFIDYKCMYCCSVAVFFCCGGRYTFCTPCHNDAMSGGPKV